ncbi:helix-turn-helix domain-containing protein [Tenacibaculum aestuarii]|uniref:helix-turn-helix domain-containing protein n=1 Tax=Tenacibaculum aestuarii TaxID=362781 RepID=UPI003893B561
MAVYLIQHITTNKTAIELAIAFYSKLQLTLFKKCINCWVDYKKNSVFYLIKAIDKKDIKKLYHKSINLQPYKISSVNSHLAYAFFKSEQQLKVIQSEFNYNFHEHSILFLAKAFNKKLLLCKLKKHKAQETLLYKKTIIQNLIHSYGGSQIETKEKAFIASFPSLKKAFDCSVSIQKRLNKKIDCFPVKIILHPYDYNQENNSLHSTISKLNELLYFIKTKKQLIISSQIANSNTYSKYTDFKHNNVCFRLNPEAENFLLSLLSTISKNYQNPNFNIPNIASMMMMCKTKLYRNCKATTGKSINQIVKEFRLLKSIKSITVGTSDINQTSIEVGFNSSSYFSNCFKKKFGISPTTLQKQQEELNIPYYI